METALSLLVGLFFAAGVYLILSRALIRIVIGLVVLGNGVNLLIFVGGRVTQAVPPIVPKGVAAPALAMANPLPQALILTAIVIGFAMFAFLVVLAVRAYETMDADNTDAMRLAEPEHSGATLPLDY